MRGSHPNRRSIDEQPEIVEERNRMGDWESDRIIAKNHQLAIETIVKRNSSLYLIQNKKIKRTTKLLEKQSLGEYQLTPKNRIYR